MNSVTGEIFIVLLPNQLCPSLFSLLKNGSCCDWQIKCTSEELIYKVRVIGIGSFVGRRPWSGEKVEHERRDLRRGTVLCSVKRYSQGLALRWVGLMLLTS